MLVTSVASTLLGAALAIGTLQLQTEMAFTNWRAQHRIELAAQRYRDQTDLVKQLVAAYSEYRYVDMELEMASRFKVARLAFRAAFPNVDFKFDIGIPETVSWKDLQRQTEVSTRLDSVIDSFRVYFDPPVVKDAERFLATVHNAPTSKLDPRPLVAQLKQLNNPTLGDIYQILSPYFIYPRELDTTAMPYRVLLTEIQKTIAAENAAAQRP
jgi:hypothetical protein